MSAVTVQAEPCDQDGRPGVNDVSDPLSDKESRGSDAVTMWTRRNTSSGRFVDDLRSGATRRSSEST